MANKIDTTTLEEKETETTPLARYLDSLEARRPGIVEKLKLDRCHTKGEAKRKLRRYLASAIPE